MLSTHLSPFAGALRWSAGLLLFSLTQAAHAGEMYFLVVFGAERSAGKAKYTHSWAVFVRACGDGPCPEDYQLEWHTISWLPRSLDVELGRMFPEPGVNLGLHETFRYVYGLGEHVSQWGPYRIEKDLYDRSLKQLAHLESGKVHYKAVDTAYPAWLVSNCIHGVDDVVVSIPRLRVITPLWGEVASYFITRRLSPWIVNPNETYPWVEAALGIQDYPVIHQTLDHGFLRRHRQQRPHLPEEAFAP